MARRWSGRRKVSASVRTLRLCLRLPGLPLTTLLIYVGWVLGLPVALLLGRREAWRRRAFQAWGRACCAWMGVAVERSGSRPRPPFLLVCNHLSYVDIFVLAGETGCVFLSKAEIGRWPVVGFMARCMGTLFVDRTRRTDVARVIRQIEERLALAQGIVLFPEGTSTAGDSVLPFRTSLLEPAARARLPVYFATIRYATPAGEPAAREAVCWWGDMGFFEHFVQFARVRRTHARLVFGDQAVQHHDRKVLASRLHEEVRARFVPVGQA